LTVAGVIDYFPTWYPEIGPLIVGNLDYLFLQAGGVYPYNVLLKTNPDIDPTTIESTRIRSLDQRIRPVDWKTPTEFIRNAQLSPQYQGLMGVLFIGSITTTLITGLTFLLHLVYTFQNRSVEFNVLRAGGLSIYQMVAVLIWEFTILILLGGILGTVLGLISGNFFIPYLQVGEGSKSVIPPFELIIPWDTITSYYWLFGFLFILALLISTILLRRSRIYETVKLGDSL
jgi:putative ABC transport system permease protein